MGLLHTVHKVPVFINRNIPSDATKVDQITIAALGTLVKETVSLYPLWKSLPGLNDLFQSCNQEISTVGLKFEEVYHPLYAEPDANHMTFERALSSGYLVIVTIIVCEQFVNQTKVSTGVLEKEDERFYHIMSGDNHILVEKLRDTWTTTVELEPDKHILYPIGYIIKIGKRIIQPGNIILEVGYCF